MNHTAWQRAVMLAVVILSLVAIAIAVVALLTVKVAPAAPNKCNPGHPCPTLTPTPTLSPTPSPTPTATPAALGFPIRAAFYYPWYPETWGSGSHYTPSLGLYDSGSQTIIAAHVAAMQSAKIKVAIASWWGQGTLTDQRVPALLANGGVKWALYYEIEGTTDPTSAAISADLTYIAAQYGSNPNYLHIGAKPVIFVYNANDTTCAVADRWSTANAGRFYDVLKVFGGYTACANQPSSWHQYAGATATDRQVGYSFTISPGFWLNSEATPRLARDLTRWCQNVRDQVASGESWQLVVSFNEWGEGTQLESSTQLGTAYLDALGVDGNCTTTPTPTPTPVGATPTPSPVVTPTPIAGTDPVLMAAGDIACAPGSAVTATACRQPQTAALLGPATAVQTLGDNQYDAGSLTNFQQAYDLSWGAYKAKTNPGIGNHEGTSSGSGSGYCAYFGAAAHCNSVANQTNAAYYSYNLGTWHVIVLNSNCGAAGGCGVGSAQYNWLVADLAANPAACTLAAWHQPRFSSGSTHGSDTAFQPFWQALYDANADLVLAGHDHDYERFAPQTPGGAADPTRGIREFVVGTGGKNLYSFGTPIANSQVRNNATFGVLRLDLHATGYDFRFLPEAGKTFTDSGTGACH